MGVEIERKFLLKNDTWKSAVNNETEIAQGFLNTHKERTVRVRTSGTRAYLTIKGITNEATRAEYEYEIPKKDAEEMLEMCEQPIIIKTRFNVFYRGKRWEIDVFEGQNAGLVVAEIELATETEAIDLPDWVGEEVTGDVRYYNSNLIALPFEAW